MQFDRSKFMNMVVNVVAIGLLLGAIYAAVAFILIPVAKFLWVASVTAVKDGYRQSVALAETFMQWDMAVYLLLGLAVYLLPTLIAFKKRHRSRRGIFFTNLFFGWSVIGWVLPLIWCLSATESPQNQLR